MKLSASEPGIVISGVAHATLLLATLVAFSRAPTLPDAQETVPVEVVSESQFNAIMKGEKEAKKVEPKAAAAEKVIVTPPPQAQPEPPVKEAKLEPPVPPPLRRETTPEPDETPPLPPTRPQALTPPQNAPEPPPRPVMPPTPPAPVPRPPDAPKAEPDHPHQQQAVEPPRPPERPKTEAKVVTPPTPPERPKPPVKEPPKVDQLARLIDQQKTDEPPKPVSRPRASDAPSDKAPKLNPAEIAKLLSRDQGQRKPVAARDGATTNASLGAPAANAPKMSPSLWGQLDGLLQERYKQCWTYLGLSNERKYIPQIKVEYTPEGALAAEPALLNPPSDPGLRSLADSAMRAVRRCNPLQIPSQYAPYHEQWKARILRFDPEEMAG